MRRSWTHAPEGTQFRLEPGIYRQQTIRPKNRQKFNGQDGVILTGAMVLESWTNAAGIWKQEGLPGPLPFHGECEDGGELCRFREDLFVNDRLYQTGRSPRPTLAPANGTTKTAGPIWPMIRLGDWSSLA